MAEDGTLCINADVVKKAGTNANATAVAEASTNVLIKQAEGVVCAATQYDWVTNYATVTTRGKEVLRDATSSLAAMYVIQWDMSGYPSRIHAETMMDVLDDRFNKLMKLFETEGVLDFMGKP